jgi:putative restriction endonuclease
MERILRIYEKCMISGCDAKDALEAAHIRPYSEGGTYDISNGLLLRADIHTLFDLGLIAIDTTDMSVILHPVLESTSYREFKGQRLQFIRPNRENLPDADALDERRKVAGL